MAAVAAIFAHYVTTTVVTFETVAPSAAQWEHKHGDVTGSSLPFLACEVGGEVAGYAYATPWRPKPAYARTVEDTIYLSAQRTGQGLGTRMLRALLRESRRAGREQVIAVIADSGEAASLALHASCGFTHAGRLRAVGHKHGRHIDTILMQCDLTASAPDGTR
jgi:L-amino acid N-acyltransferase YncA